MRKLVAVLLLAVFVASFAACTAQDVATPTPTPEKTEQPSTSTPTPTPTPEVTPTPSVTPTPTTKPEGAGMTEEEMGILPVGKYKISVEGVEGYLSFNLSDKNIEEDKPLFISTEDTNNTFTIIYQTTHVDQPSYTLSPNDEVYHVVGLPLQYASAYYIKTGAEVYSNYRMRYSGSSRHTTQDSSSAIRWYFEKNEDGTYKMALYTSTDLSVSNLEKYYACYEDGKIVIRNATENKSSNFKLEMVERGSAQFLQYISDGGKITLRLPPKLKREFIITPDKKRVYFTDERAQKWANDVEDCYYSFIELTNYVPHQNIIVKAYANCDYMAYVTSGYNTITVSYSAFSNDFGGSSTWYVTDIKELVARGDEANDVNFAILHEMGHMFDIGTDWYFETEAMTDFKLAYCLDKNGLSAIPSEFLTTDVFTYENIEDAYLNLGKDISKTGTYTYYGGAYRMILIQKQIGWEPFRQTYHWFMENRSKKGTDEYVEIPSKKYERCELFYTKVSEFAQKDVIAMIPANEWKVWLEYLGKPADE